MSYVSFYRKWRPQKFSEIIGQEHIIQTLQNSITKNKISHSYIFCGPKGTGKTSMARIFAKALNCARGPSTEPCNNCDNCTSITAGINVDVIEIDAASNRGIDDIRELRDKVKYLPVNLRKKVYIIDEAHQITTAAFNAFLKVLEEPPEHVVFIMATTEPHEVIPTIMSRCQRFDFEPVPVAKIKKRISEIASNENIDITESAVDLIAKHADGSLRDADGILEQLSSFGDTKITVDDVISLLGIIDREMLFELTNIILEKNLNQALLFIKRITSSSINLKIFTSEFLEHLYYLFTIKNYEKPLDILDITEESREKYFAQASLISSEELMFLLNLFSEFFKEIKSGQSLKIFFNTAILKAINTGTIMTEGHNKKIKSAPDEINNLKKHVDIILKTDSSGTEKVQQQKNIQEEKTGHEQKETAVKSSENKAYEKTSGDVKDNEQCEKIVKENWEKILAQIKNKNISIQAMFKEIRHFSVKEGTIYFFLDEKKSWHKEQLNRTNNILLVQDILKSAYGLSLKIVFDFIQKENHEKTENLTNNIIEDNNNAGRFFRTQSENNGSESSEADKQTDSFKYFEEKFNINR